MTAATRSNRIQRLVTTDGPSVTGSPGLTDEITPTLSRTGGAAAAV
jgi:hypothetical protein